MTGLMTINELNLPDTSNPITKITAETTTIDWINELKSDHWHGLRLYYIFVNRQLNLRHVYHLNYSFTPSESLASLVL
jgi:hypothetical protein